MLAGSLGDCVDGFAALKSKPEMAEITGRLNVAHAAAEENDDEFRLAARLSEPNHLVAVMLAVMADMHAAKVLVERDAGVQILAMQGDMG